MLGDLQAAAEDVKDKPEFQGSLKAGKDGQIKDETGKVIANLSTEELKKLGKQTIVDIDGSGVCFDKKGNAIAQATIPEPEELDYSVLKGLKINKSGNVSRAILLQATLLTVVSRSRPKTVPSSAALPTARSLSSLERPAMKRVAFGTILASRLGSASHYPSPSVEVCHRRLSRTSLAL